MSEIKLYLLKIDSAVWKKFKSACALKDFEMKQVITEFCKLYAAGKINIPVTGCKRGARKK
jgi:hypothetical protein